MPRPKKTPKKYAAQKRAEAASKRVATPEAQTVNVATNLFLMVKRTAYNLLGTVFDALSIPFLLA